MGENLEGLVKFIYGTQAQYDAINSSNYDEDALYFLTDTNKLYKGSTLIANYVNERVIAAALVDLNNTATSLNTKITKNSSDISDLSTRLSDIGEVVQEEIQPLVGQISDISTKLTDVSANLSELDEVFAAVANDLNDRINVNTANLLNASTSIEAIQDDIDEISDNLYDVSTEVFGLDIALAAAANDLNDRIIENSENILNVSTDLVNVISNVYDISTGLLDVSTDVETLDRLLAIAANDLDVKISNVSSNVANILDNFDSLVGPSLTDLSTRLANVETGTPMVLDLSTRMLDVSADLEELDFILATVGTQLDQRITDVSAICDQNYSQLNWVVINN